MQPTKIFAARLKELCRTAPSISQVARDLDINRQQFARYLNGTTMPRPNVVQQIADYFSIEASQLYQLEPANAAEGGSPIGALQKVVGQSFVEPILPHELPAGFYLQYKQTFSMPGRIMQSLAYVKNIGGVYHYKRRTSAKLLPYLPGASVTNTCNGVFVKQGGSLVMLDVGARMGEMTYHAFRTASAFDPHVKPGVHMTAGRMGSLGPRAARICLHHLPKGISILAAAREQRVMNLDEVPEVIRIHLQGPLGDTGGVFGIG